MEQPSKWDKFNNQEFLSGVIALLLFGIIKYLSMRLPAKVSGYPIVMSNAAFALAVLFFIRCLYRLKKGTLNPKKMFKKDREGQIRYWLALAMLVLYAAVFKRLGFLLSTILFLLAFTQAFDSGKNWKLNIAVSVGFTAVIYVAFKVILGIPLPALSL